MTGPPILSSHIYYQPPNPIPGLSFRLAQYQDLEMLWKNCYPERSWEQFRDHFEYLLQWQENGRCYVLVAEAVVQSPRNQPLRSPINRPNRPAPSPEIIGSGQLIVYSDKAEIAELFISESFQNRKIGTAVIQILTRIAKEQQVGLLEIGATPQNEKALRLYRRLGFDNVRHLQLPGSEKAVLLSKVNHP
jgi:ribosomal protein S18 acetylase RimI-like enzyme